MLMRSMEETQAELRMVTGALPWIIPLIMLEGALALPSLYQLPRGAPSPRGCQGGSGFAVGRGSAL